MAPNFPLYYCACTTPSPLPPSATHPSSACSLHPLDSLYFCDECDAIRCERCVLVEITSYYCPNCLFEVPNASVRAERNRCARNCFQCPECSSALHVVASDPPEQSLPATSIQASMGQPPYFLQCRGCQWSSSQIGMSFEKPLGLAHQVLEQEKTSRETVEVDRLQSHFDHYIHRLTQSLERQAFLSTPRIKKSSAGAKAFGAGKTRYPYGGNPSPNPTGHGMGRHGMSPAVGGRSKVLGSPLHPAGTGRVVLPPPISEDPDDYRPKVRWRDVAREEVASGKVEATVRNWRDDSLVFDDDEDERDTKVSSTREARQVEEMLAFKGDVGKDEGTSGFANIEKLWDQSWAQPRSIRTQRPSRIPLLAKRTKRCPTCTHTLIRPESKPHSTRFKIKIAAMHYLPGLEVGARTRVGSFVDAGDGSWRDGLTRAHVVRGASERLERSLVPGHIYAFQLALTNPLLESISVTLEPRCTSLFGLTEQPERYFDVWFPCRVVQVGAFGETAEDIKKRQGQSGIDNGAEWIEEGESVTKVGFCVVLHEALKRRLPAQGRKLELQFDLNLEFTYTVEEEYTPEFPKPPSKASSDKKGAAVRPDSRDDADARSSPRLRKVEKTFSFDTRVTLGAVSPE